MLTKRVSHMAVELNGSIYIIGGWDGQGEYKLFRYLKISKSAM